MSRGLLLWRGHPCPRRRHRQDGDTTSGIARDGDATRVAQALLLVQRGVLTLPRRPAVLAPGPDAVRPYTRRYRRLVKNNFIISGKPPIDDTGECVTRG